MKTERIDWNNIYKIRIANPSKSFEKHEIIKTLIVMKLLEKYKKVRHWIRIYTEMPLTEKIICDIYFENIKSKEIYCYEIQREVSDSWKEQKKREYSEYNPSLKFDWFIINVSELSDNIRDLSKQLDEILI